MFQNHGEVCLVASKIRISGARRARVNGVGAWDPLESFPITWNQVIEKESFKFKELRYVLIEKVEQLFRDRP